MNPPYILKDLPGNFATYICEHIFHETRPINDVYRDPDDGDLVVMCGVDDHDFDGEDRVHLVGFGHLITREPSLGTLPEIAAGGDFERAGPGLPWRRYDATFDEDEH